MHVNAYLVCFIERIANLTIFDGCIPWHFSFFIYSSRSCELYPIGTYLTMPSSVELSKKQRSFSNLPFSFGDGVTSYFHPCCCSLNHELTFEISYSMILILHTKRERTKTSAEVETNQDIHKNISYFFQEKN